MWGDVSGYLVESLENSRRFESRRWRPFVMAFATYRSATQEITLPMLRLHFCDSNAAEFDLDKRLFNLLEEMIDSLTLDTWKSSDICFRIILTKQLMLAEARIEGFSLISRLLRSSYATF
jgi:hypothetical protein